jgi:hypothetical protein
MAENPRIEELRRRVQADPASIAFAALAEEFRRAGRYDEAIDTCRTGLKRHPAYLSARVTLGRAFIETGEIDAAREELETVLRSAPENLAAIRGMAQIHEKLGQSSEMDPHLAAMMHTMSTEQAARSRTPVAVTVEPQPRSEPEPVLAIEPAAEPLPDLSFDRGADAASSPRLDLPIEQPIDLAAAFARIPVAPRAPAEDRLPVAEETPVVAVPPVEAVPAAEAFPPVDDFPVDEAFPVVEKIALAEKVPVVEEIARAVKVPVVEEIALAEELPVVEEIAPAKQFPVVEDIALVEETPAVEPLPAIGHVATAEHLAVIDPGPDPEMLATLARLEHFLAKIQIARHA